MWRLKPRGSYMLGSNALPCSCMRVTRSSGRPNFPGSLFVSYGIHIKMVHVSELHGPSLSASGSLWRVFFFCLPSTGVFATSPAKRPHVADSNFHWFDFVFMLVSWTPFYPSLSVDSSGVPARLCSLRVILLLEDVGTTGDPHDQVQQMKYTNANSRSWLLYVLTASWIASGATQCLFAAMFFDGLPSVWYSMVWCAMLFHGYYYGGPFNRTEYC